MIRSTLLFLTLFAVVAGAAFGGEIWIDVPFVEQASNGCGAAVLSMVLQYWTGIGGDPAADAAAIYRELYSEKEKGIRGSDMQKYFRQHGFQAYVFSGEWADFEHHLSRGRPLIVAFDSGNRLHYAVAAGVDSQAGLVLLNDPAQRKLLKKNRSSFEEAWKSTGNWTLLAVPGKQ